MTGIDDKQPESARQSAQDAQQRARIRELEDKVGRYRQASEDALPQLDWCIAICTAAEKGVARSLARNRSYIRTHLLRPR
jgi:hypothetical protein